MTITVVLAYLACICQAQTPFPDSGIVFSDEVIPRIDITIDKKHMQSLLDNIYSDDEYPATFKFTYGDKNETVENIGFRLRGNTSRASKKKSFKVAFNSFESGKKFHGLEKLNLNGEHNDPTVCRAKLCWDILKDFGIISSRANLVKLFINKEYKGVYLNVEHIDEEFVKIRFGNNSGNLFKCLYPADLNYKGDSQSNYKIDAYELKTNESENDYSDLANLIGVLEKSSDNNFLENLESIFNINSFIKYMVFEIIMGHWDGYMFNKNNYYLYNDQYTKRIQFIPYDVDNTFGIDWFNIDWAKKNIYDWGKSGKRPLSDRILNNPILKKRFNFWMKQFLANNFNPTKLYPKVDKIYTAISSSVENDAYRKLDYNWIHSLSEYYNSNVTDKHVKYSLKKYIETRYNSALNQLENSKTAPIIINKTIPINQKRENTIISAKVYDEDSELNIKTYISEDDSNFKEYEMNFTEGIYSKKFIANNNTKVLRYYLAVTDSDKNTTRYPTTGFLKIGYPSLSSGNLVINEIMAKNSSTISDEEDEYDDWIEIYNPGQQTVSLNNHYLSDNSNEPDKWKFPDISIPSGDFLIVWCDDDKEQGNLHTNFKLSASGEEIGIYSKSSSGFTQIDNISFGEQSEDISYGRISDASPNFTTFSSPSPGKTNGNSTNTEISKAFNVNIYPNPFSNLINIKNNTRFNNIGIVFTSAEGKFLIRKNYYNTNNISINTDSFITNEKYVIVTIYSSDKIVYSGTLIKN